MFWHSSDWHCDHVNIIEYDNRPDADIAAMNARIIEKTNDYVKENDILINHGDFALPRLKDRDDNRAYIACVKGHLDKLRCKNILQIGGNHDKVYIKEQGDWVPNWDLWDLFQWQSQCMSCRKVVNKNKYKTEVCPFCKKNDGWNDIEGIHPMGLELRITKKLCNEHKIPEEFDGHLIVCAHYSHRVWNRSHRGNSVMLYGHSHGHLPGFKNTFDVGFNIWNRPLSLVEILTDLMPKHNASEVGKVYFGHHE